MVGGLQNTLAKNQKDQERADGIIGIDILEEEMRNSKLDSKKKSITETIIDIVIGFLLFLPVNFFVLPLFIDHIAEQNVIGILFLSSIYTSIALARKYVLRRWFESMRK